jgi:hypothetical protein
MEPKLELKCPEEEGDEEFYLIFTRYLYSKIHVKQSLLLSLLDKNYNECLFWIYELYFSGFQEECYEYIFTIYDEIYKKTNPKLLKFLEKSYYEWKEDPEKHWLIGTVVGTLCFCDYDLEEFIWSYFQITSHQIPIEEKKKTFIIRLKEEDMIQFVDKPNTNPSRKYLKSVCHFPLRTEANRLFKGSLEDLRDNFYNNWLYYASFSPVWLDRIMEFRGSVDDDSLKVVFENEDLEQEFHNKWGLETDEQSSEIQDIILGDTKEQMGIKEFCEKYRCIIPTKRIKKKEKN